MTVVHVDGLSELQVALRELPDATAKNVLRRVARTALEPIAARARALAPVDDGTLRESITVGTRLSRRQRSQHQKESPDDVEMFAGAGPLPQAHMQEFGTQHSPPQPFMRPAWDSGKEDLLETIKNEL